MWDTAADRRLGGTRIPGVERVLAFRNACVTLADGTVRIHERSARTRELKQGASAVSLDRGRILVAAGGKVHVLAFKGTARAVHSIQAGVTALARVRRSGVTPGSARDDWLVLGFKDGGIELKPTRPGGKKPAFSFEDTPSSPVVRLSPGPRGTLAVGYGNGVFGLWSLANGARLLHGRLHGPVVHLILKGDRLYAASALGQHAALDLGMLNTDYCTLMREVWKKIPIVWADGLPQLKDPPTAHRCAGK
jgi:hypothetical protein